MKTILTTILQIYFFTASFRFKRIFILFNLLTPILYIHIYSFYRKVFSHSKFTSRLLSLFHLLTLEGVKESAIHLWVEEAVTFG